MTNHEIVAEILEQRKTEVSQFAIDKAVGRANANVSNMSHSIFWLYNNELDPCYGPIEKQRILYNPKFAKGIAKNSKLGEILITRKDGSYSINKKIFEVKLNNFSSYIPSNAPEVDVTKGKIEMNGGATFLFRSAYELLKTLEAPSLPGEKIDLEQLTLDMVEAEKLGQKLTEEEQEQWKLIYNITRYIRDNNELRIQPILDPIQEEIKRSKIFAGPLVIDGGPGTGKTTTLIQRIKFLIDPTIVEYWPQGQGLLESLQGPNGWIFFSPSKHLLTFLRQAMIEEGLKATDNRSKVWRDYLNNEILHNYSLVGPERPFKLFTKNHTPLFNNEPQLLKDLLSVFEQFILKQLQGRIQRSRSFKIKDVELQRLSLSLNANAAVLEETKSLVRFVMNADELSNSYGSEIKQRIKLINEEVQKQADIVLVRLKKDEVKYIEVVSFLKEEFEKRKSADDEDGDEEPEEPQRMLVFNEGVEVRRNVRKWLRSYLLNAISTAESIPEKQKKWVEIIMDYCHDIAVQELGNKLLYSKYIQPLVAGSSTLLFRKLTALYKGFRRGLPQWFESNNMMRSVSLMNNILEESEAKLHYDERCFLVLFINTLLRQLQKQNAFIFTSEGDNLVMVYKSQQRYIVGIDEASDFSLLELGCMHSFGNPLFDCTTLCGDLMQRMTNMGIADWTSFTEYVGNGETFQLKTSYRQTPTLLDLASKFYEEVTGNPATYKSYSSASPYEPKPEVKRLNNEEEKVDWLAKRIQFIYQTYNGNIPSIAIFVQSDEAVLRLSKLLKNCETLTDNSIDVQGITEEGGMTQKGKVGIFNIKHIKGLEFEAVFFVDIDRLIDSDAQLIQKYIYVGLSRAAYYLFVTYENQLPDGLEFLRINEV